MGHYGWDVTVMKCFKLRKKNFEMFFREKEFKTGNLLSDRGEDSGKMLDLSSKVLVQNMIYTKHLIMSSHCGAQIRRYIKSQDFNLLILLTYLLKIGQLEM